MIKRNLATALMLILLCLPATAQGQTDTLHVMAYNVLYYGDTPPCQGPHSASNGYLETIVAYTNPDIIGLEKMAAIPIYAGDHSGTAPAGFADSVVQFALDAAFPGRYAYCTYTNSSRADDMSVLFYNKNKLGFAGIISSYENITDFNTYKLYYLSAGLSATSDTVFLYVTLNHDNSGTGSSDPATRGEQIAGEMAQIATHFTTLPNMLNMGDFNTHNSSEPCYQTLVAPANAGFRFYDPPFSPDAEVTYPADWDDNPFSYSDYLTTSTREADLPNTCGTNGGAKSWFDHIFVSGPIINNAAGLYYIPHSYRTIGNDGNRVGISVNDAPTNTSAPAAVIDAVFQMSNKYPVMVDLGVNFTSTGVAAQTLEKEKVTVVNPVGAALTLYFTNGLQGKTINMECMDVLGRLQMQTVIHASNEMVQVPCTLTPGVYYLRFTAGDRIITQTMITKQ